MASIYAGLRVLDLTGPEGAYAGKLFAELGADVLKIEPPSGDPGRQVGPFYQDIPGPDRSLFWWYHNASKRGLTLDFSDPADRALFHQLVTTADVLLDTAPPDSYATIGLPDARLQIENPRLIHGSLTGFGFDGPRAGWQSTDLVASAMGGLLYLSGMPHRPPSWPGGNQSWMLGANALAVGCALALLARMLQPERRPLAWASLWLVAAGLLEAAGPVFGKHLIDA
ncbi:MAG: CoA transferase, partial [Dehalococcoidia bacterium]|nr:CoA transferase [Dehalococcoidia bacterium]